MDTTPATNLGLTAINSTTWVERFCLNLLSYSLVLGPIAFIVICTRYRLWPSVIQTSALLQWFVYGYTPTNIVRHSTSKQSNDEDELLGDTCKEIRHRAATENKRSDKLTLIWCFFGLQFSYLIWGLLQEKIMTTKYQITNNNFSDIHTGDKSSINYDLKEQEKSDNAFPSNSIITFHDSQFLVFLNRIIAFVLSIIALLYNRPHKPKLITGRYVQQQVTSKQAPLYEYVYCSVSNILSSWCQYEALKYVNFPTQVLSKSCKIIPVMLMSKLMLKKKYQAFDYLCALLLSIGMFIFLLYQPVDSKITDRHIYSTMRTNSHEKQLELGKLDKLSQHIERSSLVSGLVILALYLIFDSFTSNWQQSLFTRYGMSNWQMMAATNFYSILLTITSLHQLGSLKPAFRLLASSKPLLTDCILMSLMSSIGQLFVFYTIKHFGPVVFTVIMTLRQFMAILLSCAIYSHELTLGSCAGLIMVFLVAGWQVWHRWSSPRNKVTNEKLPMQSRISRNLSQVTFKSHSGAMSNKLLSSN